MFLFPLMNNKSAHFFSMGGVGVGIRFFLLFPVFRVGRTFASQIFENNLVATLRL